MHTAVQCSLDHSLLLGYGLGAAGALIARLPRIITLKITIQITKYKYLSHIPPHPLIIRGSQKLVNKLLDNYYKLVYSLIINNEGADNWPGGNSSNTPTIQNHPYSLYIKLISN